MNNCFSIIFKGEGENLEENLAKHENQMSLSLAITPRNPTITTRTVIINAELLYSPLKIILNENSANVCCTIPFQVLHFLCVCT